MAIFTMTNVYVLVNSVDLTDHCYSVTVTDERNAVDVTVFGVTYVQETKGLGTAAIGLEMFQDFASGKVHGTLQPLIGSTTGVPVEIRPTNAARSATNPAILLASGLLFAYPALDGSAGDAAAVKFEFRNAPGGTGITYPTS